METYSEDYYIRVLFNKMQVREIMETAISTIEQHDDLSSAQAAFISKKIPYIFVVDKEKKLVGLLSQKYLYKAQSPRKMITDDMELGPDIIMDGNSYYSKETLNSFYLTQVMNKNPLSIKDDAKVAEAITLMADKNIACIPVVDAQNVVCGAITNEVIMHYLSSVLQE
jgi:CBS domain-containing protein